MSTTSTSRPRRLSRAVRCAGAVAAIAVVGVVATPGLASAAPIDDLRTRCTAAIDQRLTTLDELTSKIAASTDLSVDHAATLTTEVADEKTGLQALKITIAGDAEIGVLRADCRKIIDDYRVYLLEVPTVHLTIAGDAALAVVATAEGLAPSLQSRIDAAVAAGKDVGNAQDLMNDYNAQVAAAKGLVQPIGDTVIPLTPADYNAGIAGPVLDAARTSLHTARDDLRTARSDAHQIMSLTA